MARSGPLLTEAQWKKIAPLLPKPPKQRKGGRPWIENRRVLEGILWILRRAGPAGEIPASFDLLAAAARLGGAGRLVEHLADVSKRVERAPAIAMERVVSGRQFCSSEKKGRWSRENQAGQGDEVDGGGRRPRSSFGKLPSLCIPGGSPARGNDARGDPRRPNPPCGATATETHACDR